MAGGKQRIETLLDAEVLGDYLLIDRLDLLARSPHRRFVMMAHAVDRMRKWYPDRESKLAFALSSGRIGLTSPSLGQEAQFRAAFARVGRLSDGACALLAAGIARGMPVAVDGDVPNRVAREMFGFTNMIDTSDIMVDAIRATLVPVDVADGYIDLWNERRLLPLPFKSYTKIL